MEENDSKVGSIIETFQSGSQLITGGENAEPKKMTFLNAFSAIFNGLGIGLLLGILLSTTLSPVVSGVIATVSSLLAVLIGLNEKYLDPIKSLRIGSFGLFTVAGIIAGLYLRANNPFAPTLKDKMEEYKSIGFSDEEARNLIIGFIKSDTSKAQREASLLYSTIVNSSDCDVLYYMTAETPVPEMVNTFRSTEGIWRKFADTFQTELPDEMKGKSLLLVRDSFCNSSSSEPYTISNTEKIKAINPKFSLEEMETQISASGENWKNLVSMAQSQFSESERLQIYKAIQKVFE
ncbi:hypothetical protein [Aquiflexum gelatinilyticum]|uniref:hypothetical protein n=1 Tax=Aquiflexum gelatinilyticum TaxID=2961943 RepID=UPI002167D626|nr:hypothetical protein [Aquiflexum gelatinilyticum]MCS4433196.1 hypothetical protein [Aquiflexum gelatinilyticum]